MKVGSLFSGIGGFDLGLERAGMQVVWQVENDPFCNKVLAKHWQDVQRFGDIKDCGKHNLEPVDLICGGWPCQPFSVAGKQRGAADDRYLWPEVIRIVEALRPTWFLGENVPGIIRMDLDNVLIDLDNAGYAAKPISIPACGLGAPHRRERVFVVAYGGLSKQQRRNKEAYGQRQRKSSRREPSPYGGEARRAVADTSQRQNDGRERRDLEEKTGSGECLDPAADLGCENVAHTEIDSLGAGLCTDEPGRQRGTRPCDKGCAVDNAMCRRHRTQENEVCTRRHSPVHPSWWSTEPDVGRVAHGVPSRVDRLRSLGNAVVPQIVEFIGRQIMRYELSAT